MNTKLLSLFFLLGGISTGQTPAPNSISSASSNLQATLQRIEQTSQAAALDLARLRPDKWKADGDIRDQAQANADSISRNLTTALPTLISGVRTAPQSMAANFKLYRNLNALYDVFESLAESAGAFGSKQEFEALSRHVQDVDTFRRTFGDYMETLAAAKDTELARARAATPSGTQSVRPKKIIVDNDPAPKTSKKKR
jgi:hypothetical protein